ncbi:hypothetical protein [Gryllotalpicola sp.]|uniref:hypothetical protein n=1 Tax=Gryllotalpicola sp. TaxID=1932787 RepID=UPI002636CC7A|nr:hypothetical protein [Gryllotalpicola sp.]
MVQKRYPTRGAATPFVVWGIAMGVVAGFLAVPTAFAGEMSGGPADWVILVSAVAAPGTIPGMLAGGAAGALIGGLALTMFRATQETRPLGRRAAAIGFGAGLMTGVLFAAADFGILGGMFDVPIDHWPIHVLEVLAALGAGFGYTWLTRHTVRRESATTAAATPPT